MMEKDTNEVESVSDTFYSTKIRERSAEILSDVKVFYNPVQEFNRDLSVLVLNAYFHMLLNERILTRKNNNNEDVNDSNDSHSTYVPGQKYEDGMRILEALSATGLRSIRYAKEVPGVKEIVANDLSLKAVETIRKNVEHNKVDHLIEVNHENAMTLMYLTNGKKKWFDVIDLDPYGCPNQFLDGAVQSIANGGLLLITATDMAVLAGNAPEACFVKYGSVPVRMKCCHEMSLRILLNCIETHANRYGKYIEPLLSISADFYVRVFVRVFSGQAKCKYSMSKQSMIYQCTGCDTYTLHPLGILKPNPTEKNPNQVKFAIPTGPPVGQACDHCGQKHHLGGPIWSHPIHNMDFVMDLLQLVDREPLCQLGTQRRIVGMLNVISEELPDVPLYYSLDKLCCVLKLEIMPMQLFRSALLHAGYRVSYSHAFKNSVKTNAPPNVIWDILRCWNKEHPVKKERMENNAIINRILNKAVEAKYKFELHPEANPKSRKEALSRFQANPTPFWGPGTRATIMVSDKSQMSKSIRNQNKNQGKKSKGSPVQVPKCKQIKMDE